MLIEKQRTPLKERQASKVAEITPAMTAVKKETPLEKGPPKNIARIANISSVVRCQVVFTKICQYAAVTTATVTITTVTICVSSQFEF